MGFTWLSFHKGSAGEKRVARLLARWGLTRKIAKVTSPNKYTAANIWYMFRYANWVSLQNPLRLKFLDEAAFENWDLIHRKVRCPKGTNVRLCRNLSEDSNKTYNVTYLTSLTHPRGGMLLSVREGTNDG
eukprot:gb/GEZN01010792.1/.p1 GENE.gb/GEZN01010792.1/~~gb/GEZN01010792.1/.p1  ORF type:complete len:130 (-),score=3.79 gb/GEZN01010792.1/:523-912(-)